MRRTTIKDVAKAAGVSITTVSHALSGGSDVKQETRERIEKLAAQMNYMPSFSGRNLKNARTGVIGLYSRYIRGFYGVLADAMCDACQQAGFELDVILAESGDMVMSSILSKRVDGAIILHSGFGDRHTEVLRETELPAVFLDREFSAGRISSVLFDSYKTGCQAADYLCGLGHREFMFIKGQDTYDGVERRRGFYQRLRERGIDLPSERELEGAFDRTTAQRSMERFIASGAPMPTGIFAANDDSAIGCILALTAAGYRVPEDVSILGCDNIELGQWYTPSLTTMKTGISTMGRLAAQETIALINGEHPGRITKTESTIVERGSCAGAPLSEAAAPVG